MNENVIASIVLFLYFSPVYYHLYFAIRESKRGNKSYLRKFKKILNWSFIILIPFIIIIAILSHTNYLDYESPLTFDKVDQITFENFRGIELFKKSLYGNEKFAYIQTSIECEIENENVTIEALFHPSGSFVYKKTINSEELLTHEIFHFKITELFVRKAKKRITGLNNPTKEEIEEVIKDLKTQERKFQKQYDYDTFHSYVYGEQKRYEKLIDSSLNSYSHYTQPKIIINEIQ